MAEIGDRIVAGALPENEGVGASAAGKHITAFAAVDYLAPTGARNDISEIVADGRYCSIGNHILYIRRHCVVGNARHLHCVSALTGHLNNPVICRRNNIGVVARATGQNVPVSPAD